MLINTATEPVNMQNNSVSLPDDDIPVQSKGAYTLNLDNLDAINPFQSSIKMANSPPKSSTSPVSWVPELTESDTTTAIACTPKDEQKGLEVTDTPLDETLPFVSSVENSLVDNSANISSAEGTVIIKTNNNERSITDNEESDITEPIQDLIPVMEDPIPVIEGPTQDLPLPPAGSYNLDFDNLEMLNPFLTGGSKIPNSPTLNKAVGVPDPPQPSKEATQAPEISAQTSPTVSDAPSAPEEKPAVTEVSPSTTSPKENPILLEFNFNDGAEVKCKPPPKRLGMKRPAGAKPVSKKTDTVVKEKKESEPKQMSHKNSEETEPVDVPSVKGAYAFGFDKFDDPKFNPFGTVAKMGNSPPRGIQTSPVSMESALPVEKPVSPPREEQFETVVQDEPKPRYKT